MNFKRVLHKKLLRIYLVLVLAFCVGVDRAIAEPTQVKLDIDSAACYIIDPLLSSEWANSLMTPGNGSTDNIYWPTVWLYRSSVGKITAYKGSVVAEIDGLPLQYSLKQGRAGKYDNDMGMLNMKNLYRSVVDEAFNENQLQSYLELPTLPSVGKFILYVLKPYKSGVSEGIAIDKKREDGTWEEVLRFVNPAKDSYVYLHQLSDGKIISQTPVTYRIRSYSYNTSTSAGYGPIIGSILIQKYKEYDTNVQPALMRPYYPMTESSSAVSTADNLINTYPEDKWLGLVPTQAPRSLQHSPASVNSSDWTWDPAKPDQITCSATKTVFPNNNYTQLTLQTTVMSGKIVNVPYYRTSNGVTYVQAEIDYYKTAFMSKNLPIMATAYQRTKDEKYARYVALALDKWANAVPDFFMTEGWNKSTIVNKQDMARFPTIQRASDHNGFTHEFHDGEVLAFDRIYDSQALKDLSTLRGYDVRKHITNDLFLNITLWLKDQPMESHASTNLVGHIGVMVRVAAIIEDEAIKRDILDFVDRYYTIVIGRNFKRDGMYPESFSYHKGYAEENYANVKMLEDYFLMFPPTNAEMQKIADQSNFRKAFTQRTTQVHKNVGFPNGDMAPFDDTAAGSSDVRTSTKSYLLPAYYHAMLGDGSGSQQIQSNIGANDKANHVGNSMMSMTLFANGEEQIGDIRYSRLPGRSFTNSVQAHNLVAVNEETTQYFTSARQVFGNSGHIFSNGYFTFFEPGLNGIAATEVYSNTIRPNVVSRYQRIHILNTIDPAKPYLVDLFVVKGGSKHDYILNGSTQIDQTATSSLSLTKIDKTYPLLPSGETYTDPVLEGDNTNWYGAFREMSTARSTGNWDVTYAQSLTKGVRIFAVDDATTNVYLGKAPHPYRRSTASSLYAYWRPALVERRIGSDGMKSIFAHVIEAYNGATSIASVTQIPLLQGSDEYIGLSVRFISGREDIILINLNDRLITGVEPIETICSADGKYTLKGKIGVFSCVNENIKTVLIGGESLSANGNKTEITNYSYAGTISSSVRKEDGADCYALITDVPIPAGNDLKGRWMQVKFGTYTEINPPSGAVSTQSNMSELFQIESVKTVGGKTYIVTAEDHCLSVNGNNTLELMRPQRAFVGPTTFTIMKSKSETLSSVGVYTPEFENQRVLLYPNPVINNLNIQAAFGIKRIVVRTLSGIMVKSMAVDGKTSVVMPMLDLENGLYLIQIGTADGIVKTERLVVMR
ncbi:MAG TPA: T9SS type A sorting domain-containing protein [Bacteroidales bacterium]|nr:T9SS type A sorting domain-containing protein [Bacteroidales bacterium]